MVYTVANRAWLFTIEIIGVKVVGRQTDSLTPYTWRQNKDYVGGATCWTSDWLSPTNCTTPQQPTVFVTIFSYDNWFKIELWHLFEKYQMKTKTVNKKIKNWFPDKFRIQIVLFCCFPTFSNLSSINKHCFKPLKHYGGPRGLNQTPNPAYNTYAVTG